MLPTFIRTSCRWFAASGGRRTGWRFWAGVGAGVGLAVVLYEFPYVNWRPVVPPLDAQPLVIRQDAKGDGQFGAPRSGGRRHRGIDLLAPLGSPVRAIRSGTVTQVGMHRGLGRFVVIEHRQALTSLYAHLAEARVDVGERVTQGQLIGTVGKTGNARHRWISPHVHLEITRAGESVDPSTVGLRGVVSSSKGPPKEAQILRPVPAEALAAWSDMDDRGGE